MFQTEEVLVSTGHVSLPTGHMPYRRGGGSEVRGCGQLDTQLGCLT